MYPNVMILNIFYIVLRCLIHLNHNITCFPLKILTFVNKQCVLGPRINIAENMDPIRVQKHLQRTPFRALIFIYFFICTAKRPLNQHEKNKKASFFFFFCSSTFTLKVLDPDRLQTRWNQQDTEGNVKWVVSMF